MLAADLLAVAAVALGFGGYLAHLVGTPAVANALALLAVTVGEAASCPTGSAPSAVAAYPSGPRCS